MIIVNMHRGLQRECRRCYHQWSYERQRMCYRDCREPDLQITCPHYLLFLIAKVLHADKHTFEQKHKQGKRGFIVCKSIKGNTI